MSIADYQISSDNSNNHQKPTASYKYVNKQLANRCKSTIKSENHHKYLICKCTNTGSTVLYMSINLWLYHLHSLLPVDKKVLCHMLGTMYRNPLEVYDYHAINYTCYMLII